MRETLLLVLLTVALATCASLPYRGRGWRPSGQHFDPTSARLYGPPDHQAPTAPTTTTPSTTTTSTTTPRSREPTTSSSLDEEEFDSNPALAIANSFAFNRPVYVYNTFPFFPGQVLVK